MLQILGRPNSINVRKVLWLADELGLAYEHRPWGTPELPLSSPEFVALNPNRLVPVVREGDFVLRESNTICRWLAARARRDDLLPHEPDARGRVEMWMDWQATELNTAWRYAFLALVRKTSGYADPAAIAASVQSWNRHMAILDAQLIAAGGGYVVGATFTLADIVLGLATHRWFATPIDDRPGLGAVQAYYERLSERPAYLRHGRNGVP